MVSNSISRRWRELASGKRTLAAAMLGVAFGINSLPFYTAGLFISALHVDRGWSLSSLSLGPTLLVAVMAISAPFIGQAFDRFGERRFILPGLLVQAAGFFLLSRSEGLLGYLLPLGSMALLGAGCSSPAYLRVVNRAFDVSKGAALALTITGAALFSAIVPPLLQRIIATSGWRGGYLALAAVVLCATPFILLLLGKDAAPAKTAEPAADSTDFRYATLFASPAFLPLTLAIAAIAIAAPGLLIHFASLLTRSGLSALEAAWMISLIGGAQIVSRLMTGTLVDQFFAPRVAAVIMVAASAGIGLLAWDGARWAMAGAVAVGLAYGAEADLVGYFAGRYYVPEHFGRVFGAFYAVFLAGTAISPSLYGLAVDRFGSYTPALVGASLLLLVAASLFLMLPRFPTPQAIEEAKSENVIC